jgi:ABC-type glycerol-3-phosphate transport system permease component
MRESRLVAPTRYLAAFVLAAILMLPLLYALSGALHTNAALFQQPFQWIPRPAKFGNYRDVWTTTSFPRQVLNSFIVGAVIAVGGVMLAQMAGYALAKKRFWGRDLIFWSIVATMMIPFPAIMVGVFILAKDLHILNTYLGLIVPGLMTGQVVFFMRQYMIFMPDELLQSARVDGASEWQVYWHIVFPLSWPVMASMGILTFVDSWNNLLWPLIVVQSQDLYTIPLGLAQYSSKYFTNYVGILAMSVLAIIPVIALFLFARKRLLDAIMVSGGAMKG